MGGVESLRSLKNKIVILKKMKSQRNQRNAINLNQMMKYMKNLLLEEDLPKSQGRMNRKMSRRMKDHQEQRVLKANLSIKMNPMNLKMKNLLKSLNQNQCRRSEVQEVSLEIVVKAQGKLLVVKRRRRLSLTPILTQTKKFKNANVLGLLLNLIIDQGRTKGEDEEDHQQTSKRNRTREQPHHLTRIPMMTEERKDEEDQLKKPRKRKMAEQNAVVEVEDTCKK